MQAAPFPFFRGEGVLALVALGFTTTAGTAFPSSLKRAICEWVLRVLQGLNVLDIGRHLANPWKDSANPSNRRSSDVLAEQVRFPLLRSFLNYSFTSRSRANMAHTRQSRSDSGLDFHVKVVQTLQGVPPSLGRSLQ